MKAKSNAMCQAYLSELHQISPADALKMLDKMTHSQKIQILNRYL